jgi:hypothetical protein
VETAEKKRQFLWVTSHNLSQLLSGHRARCGRAARLKKRHETIKTRAALGSTCRFGHGD